MGLGPKGEVLGDERSSRNISAIGLLKSAGSGWCREFGSSSSSSFFWAVVACFLAALGLLGLFCAEEGFIDLGWGESYGDWLLLPVGFFG